MTESFPYKKTRNPAADSSLENGEGRGPDSCVTGRVNTSAWALLRLAGPIFLANLSVICSSTLDTVMAGRLSAVDMAGVALGMAVASWISISLSGVLQGIAPVAGFSYGAKKFREVGIELHHALILALIFCVPGVIGTAAADFWCTFAELDADAAVVAQNYLWASAFALPPILLARCFISVNAAVNHPQAAMIITAVMLALKVPLNEIFMKGWGAIPAMGGAGAAVSTAILSWGALVAYWLYWKTAPDFAAMRPTRRPKIALSNFESLLRIGFPIGVAGFFEMTSFTMMTILLARLGESVISRSSNRSQPCLPLLCFTFGYRFGRDCAGIAMPWGKTTAASQKFIFAGTEGSRTLCSFTRNCEYLVPRGNC